MSHIKKVNSFHFLFLIGYCSILLTGCSSIYTVNDFQSKDKFYDSFNKSVKNKAVNITLSNDSSFSILDGVILENDTLFTFKDSESKQAMSFAKTDIIKINYTSNDYKSASFLLPNDKELKVSDINFSGDSIYVNAINNVSIKHFVAPIASVRTVVYKNRLKRLPLGILSGTLSGLLTGVLIGKISSNTNHDPHEESYVVLLTPVGTLVGTMISFIFGYQYIYQFNK